jgi:type IV secretory pathway VirB10-like protein
MSTKALVIAVVGVGCTLAAGTGAFLAQKMNFADANASQIEAPAPAVVPVAAPAAFSDAVVPASTPAAPAKAGPAVTARSDGSSSERDRPAATRSRQTSANREMSEPRAERTVPKTEAQSTAEPPLPASRPDVVAPVEAPRLPDRTERAVVLEELVVPAESVIGLRLESALSSETAQLEDRVTAVVTRDVTVNGRTAIPAGSRVDGVVMAVERGGKFRERARLGIQFTSVRLADHTTLRIRTEPVYRDGESPSREATTKIGIGAAAGAVLGGILGGKKGAVIGGATGAGAGTAVVTAGGRHAAIFEAGSSLTARLMDEVSVR